jgi:hypothetical protein
VNHKHPIFETARRGYRRKPYDISNRVQHILSVRLTQCGHDKNLQAMRFTHFAAPMFLP